MGLDMWVKTNLLAVSLAPMFVAAVVFASMTREKAFFPANGTECPRLVQIGGGP